MAQQVGNDVEPARVDDGGRLVVGARHDVAQGAKGGGDNADLGISQKFDKVGNCSSIDNNLLFKRKKALINILWLFLKIGLNSYLKSL